MAVQKGLLRLNKEFFRYHIRTVEPDIKYFFSGIPNAPRTAKGLQIYVDDMTKRCAKSMNLVAAYKYALSHNMPKCGHACWSETKELPEFIRLPPKYLTGDIRAQITFE